MLLVWGTLVQEPQQRHRESIVVERVASRHNGKVSYLDQGLHCDFHRDQASGSFYH
jgi:hypothetical protein